MRTQYTQYIEHREGREDSLFPAIFCKYFKCGQMYLLLSFYGYEIKHNNFYKFLKKAKYYTASEKIACNGV